MTERILSWIAATGVAVGLIMIGLILMMGLSQVFFLLLVIAA